MFLLNPDYKDHSVVMELEMENTSESKKTVNTVIHFRDSDNHLLKELDFEITLGSRKELCFKKYHSPKCPKLGT